MSNVAKVAGTAANTLTTPLNVEEVFSTYLYDGTAATLEINNDIDLAGEGGLVWLKSRDNLGGTSNNVLLDTERGANTTTAHLQSDTTDAASTGYLTSFDSDGFTIASNGGRKYNTSGGQYASWTFRKAPKFFDVVTWTGDGTGARTISHNLGATPGSIIRKKTSGIERWYVWHRSVSNDLSLNEATAASYIAFNATDPTSTEFTVSASGNISGETHVAYLFAHNNGDGDFGPTGDQDIIKCGSYTGGTAPISVDLGFEPQWVLIKGAVGSTQNWVLFDTMRGITTGGADEFLSPNTSSAETTFSTDYIDVTANGFEIKQSNNGFVSQNSATYIYVAIRRGPMAVPESATDVFDVQTAGNLSGLYSTSTGFTPDTAFYRDRDSNQNNILQARLTETQLITNSTSSEFTSYNSHLAGNQDGIRFDSTQNYGSSIIYQWRRAPNYFDVVAYTGDGVAGRTVSHNLGVAPEMMWVKSRSAARGWSVYHASVGNRGRLKLNDTNVSDTNKVGYWNYTDPTETQFTLGVDSDLNGSGNTYIAYLFASVDGVSKVGSYTGNGTTSNTIDCGFSAGARFIIVKRTDSTGDWWVFDTERGITSSGNDPYLELNTTNAEASYNILNANSSGFEIIQPWNDINASGGSYIFYAIA